jgi:hypothetical protein
MPGYPDIPDPVGIEAVRSLLRVMVSLSQVCPLVVGSAASIRVRFRRARGLERQQLKWLGYAVPVAMVALVLASREWAGWAMPEVVALMAGRSGSSRWLSVTILRYRLLDIDRLISQVCVATSTLRRLLHVLY